MANGSNDQGTMSSRRRSNKISKPTIILVSTIFMLILMIAIGLTVYIMSSNKKTHRILDNGDVVEQRVDRSTAVYHSIRPPFVINYHSKGRIRYLQITVELMARSEKAISEARGNMPLIKNNLVTLFSGADFESLKTYDGKERLREAALEEVQRVMMQETGEQGIEAVLFTGFVIQ